MVTINILLAIPLPYSGKIEKEVQDSIDALKGNFDIFILKDAPEDLDKGDRLWRIGKCRERIREYFLSHKEYDFLLFIDSDIVFPPETLEVLSSFDGDIVIHSYESIPLPGKKRQHLNVDIPLFKRSHDKVIILSGMGCTLIKRKVLEECNFMKDVKNWDTELGEDISFLSQAKEKGFKTIIIEDKLNLKHLMKEELDRESFWQQLKDNPSEFKRWRKE